MMEIKINEHSIEKSKKVIGTYVNQETYQFLQEKAQDEYMSISNLVRKIIYEYVKAEMQKEEK